MKFDVAKLEEILSLNPDEGLVDVADICRRAGEPVQVKSCKTIGEALCALGYVQVPGGSGYVYKMGKPTPLAWGLRFRGTFRVDDVSLNTDLARLQAIVRAVRERLPRARFLFTISPLVHDLSSEPEAERGRIFPKILNAHSDHRVFFRVDRAGIPDITTECNQAMFFAEDPEKYPLFHKIDGITYASHGLLHVDHRLLDRGQQEMSILISCSLAKSKVFVPPFNKWNRDTEEICREHGIELVKWEDGWRHAGHNGFDPSHDRYYLHEHDTDATRIGAWIDAGLGVEVAR